MPGRDPRSDRVRKPRSRSARSSAFRLASFTDKPTKSAVPPARDSEAVGMPGFSALLTFISLLALTLLGTPARAQFETRSSTPVSLFPTSIAVGDFNRDGKLDVAVGGNVLQVMLGNGDGTFRAPVTYISVSFAPTKT